MLNDGKYFCLNKSQKNCQSSNSRNYGSFRIIKKSISVFIVLILTLVISSNCWTWSVLTHKNITKAAIDVLP